MFKSLPPAHGMARTNYPIRVMSFAYASLLVVALTFERPLSGGSLAFAAFVLLVYPQLALLYARVAVDSRGAELNNLLVDAGLLGVLLGQLGMPLWILCALLFAVGVNNAICGGPWRLIYAVVLLLGSATTWMIWSGQAWLPNTGAQVAYLTIAGILGYAASVGLVVQRQNQRLVNTRDALVESEEQFRFIAENAADFVSMVDAHGRFRYASAAHTRRFDAARVAAGESWFDLVAPSDREKARDFHAALLRLRTPQIAVFRLLATDHRIVIVECRGNPVQDASGVVHRVVLVAHERAFAGEPDHDPVDAAHCTAA